MAKLDGGGDFKPKNYFVNNGIIKKVEQLFNYAGEKNQIEPEKIKDVTLKLTLDVKKKDETSYDKILFFSGNFKRDPESKEIIGWGSAMNVKIALNSLGINKFETDDRGVIPQSVLNLLNGKTVYFLTYRTDDLDDKEKNIYLTYKQIAASAEDIVKKFLKDCEKEEFSPFKYAPVGNEDFDPNDFNTGSTPKAQTKPSEDKTSSSDEGSIW